MRASVKCNQHSTACTGVESTIHMRFLHTRLFTLYIKTALKSRCILRFADLQEFSGACVAFAHTRLYYFLGGRSLGGGQAARGATARGDILQIQKKERVKQA